MPVLSRSHFRLWRFAFRRLRYLCFDIFLRRFLTNDPMQKPRFRVGRRHMVAPIRPLFKPDPQVMRHPTGCNEPASANVAPKPNVVSMRWVTPWLSHMSTLPASLVSSSTRLPAASS
jgi:hypothetical protein